MTSSSVMSELLYGPIGSLYLYSMLLVIIGLSMLVSARLLMTRRKIGYLSMIVAQGILIIQHTQLIKYSLTEQMTLTQGYILLLLKVLAFVMVNVGIYQLYNVTRRREFLLFTIVLLLTAGVSMTYWYAEEWFAASEEQLILLRPLGADLLIFALIFLSFLIIHPRIGQNVKYQVMLTVYFAEHSVHMTNLYLFDDAQPQLRLVEQLLPFVYYIVLFLFIVERVIEIMHAIYTSSITDGLTKLYNRSYFYNRVSQYIQHKEPVSVLFSDIDNFKQLNDTRGHQMGDGILKLVAQIMLEETDDTGICSRYGGEEMVVLVTDPGTDPLELAERIRVRVEDETIVTLSIGCSRWSRGLSTEQLIKRADEAMYTAKSTGKNRVVGPAKTPAKSKSGSRTGPPGN